MDVVNAPRQICKMLCVRALLTTLFLVTCQLDNKTEGLNLTKAVSGNLSGLSKLRFSFVVAILCPPLKNPVMWLTSKIPGSLDHEAKERNDFIMRESQKIINARRKVKSSGCFTFLVPFLPVF